MQMSPARGPISPPKCQLRTRLRVSRAIALHSRVFLQLLSCLLKISDIDYFDRLLQKPEIVGNICGTAKLLQQVVGRGPTLEW